MHQRFPWLVGLLMAGLLLVATTARAEPLLPDWPGCEISETDRANASIALAGVIFGYMVGAIPMALYLGTAPTVHAEDVGHAWLVFVPLLGPLIWFHTLPPGAKPMGGTALMRPPDYLPVSREAILAYTSSLSQLLFGGFIVYTYVAGCMAVEE